MDNLSEDALITRVDHVDIFAEIDPNQKQRIIQSLEKAGNVVGYMGDGINDAPAIHEADVGISVNTAADVAKQSADIVLLEQNLNVLVDGVKSGRVTFANTMKYIFMATSANFGNMFSMAGASLFLKFLPLLPKQILLSNLMTDFPELNIATDNVDEEMTTKPQHWDISFIKRFMFVFGLLSSVFDYLTFGVLIFLLNARESEFQTIWLMESVISAVCIVLVIRTRRVFFESRPGRNLFLTSIVIIFLVCLLPYTPITKFLGLVTVPKTIFLVIFAIVLLYVISAEITKKWFYKRVNR